MTNRVIARLTLFIGCLALLGGAGLLAAAEKRPTKANGSGSISFAVHEGHSSVADDDKETGRGFLLFEVERTVKGVSGSLTFGAETHHENLYPEVVIRLNKIDDVQFRGQWVRLTGNGHLQEDPVFISASAFDGEATGEDDRFGIKCTNEKGELVFSASGKLFIGNVQIGEPH